MKKSANNAFCKQRCNFAQQRKFSDEEAPLLAQGHGRAGAAFRSKSLHSSSENLKASTRPKAGAGQWLGDCIAAGTDPLNPSLQIPCWACEAITTGWARYPRTACGSASLLDIEGNKRCACTPVCWVKAGSPGERKETFRRVGTAGSGDLLKRVTVEWPGSRSETSGPLATPQRHCLGYCGKHCELLIPKVTANI